MIWPHLYRALGLRSCGGFSDLLPWILGRFFSGTVVDLAKARGVSAAVASKKSCKPNQRRRWSPTKSVLSRIRTWNLQCCQLVPKYAETWPLRTGGEAEVCSALQGPG